MSRHIAAATIFASVLSLIVVGSFDSAFARGFSFGGHSGGGHSSGGYGHSSFGGGHRSGGNGGHYASQSTRHNNTVRSSRNGSNHGHWSHGRRSIRSNSEAIVGTNNYVGGVVAVPVPITILNQAAIGHSVNYSLGQAAFAVDDRGSMVHDGGTQVIAFDRGDNFGTATYTLEPGTYRFVMTDQGLDLRTASSQGTADQVDVNATVSDN